jgi:hypothetical protein
MSIFPLNFAMRQTEGALKGNLGWLFTMYWLHSDNVLRCYPSGELLVVPLEKRLTEGEKRLNRRHFVYQITGVMELPNGKTIATVHINSPEAKKTQATLLKDLGFDTDVFWKVFGKEELEEESSKSNTNDASINEGSNPSKTETSKTEDKVVTSLPPEVNLQEEVDSSPLPPSKRGKRKRKVQAEIIDPELEVMIQAVKKECNPTSKQITPIAKLLLCRFTGNESEKNIKRPITSNQLALWATDWDKKRDPDGNKLTRPCNQGSVKKWVDIWLDGLDAKTSGVKTIAPKQDSHSQSRFNNHQRPTAASYAAPDTPLPVDALERLDLMAKNALKGVRS